IAALLLAVLLPATFVDWRYLLLAACGGLLAFTLGGLLSRLARLIVMLDAVGLSVFAVIGASKAVGLDFGYAQAIILGVITACGGGTIRDIMILRVPIVLRSELYAIPALVAAGLTVVIIHFGHYGIATALAAAAVCFAIRMLG